MQQHTAHVDINISYFVQRNIHSYICTPQQENIMQKCYCQRKVFISFYDPLVRTYVYLKLLNPIKCHYIVYGYLDYLLFGVVATQPQQTLKDGVNENTPHCCYNQLLVDWLVVG